MSSRNTSITKRLIAAVLLLELLAALGLIVGVGLNEYDTENKAFNANLRAGANALLGSIQEDVKNEVRLDLEDQVVPRTAIFRVTDENGRLLGSAGSLPPLALRPNTLEHAVVADRSYRFYMLNGERIIDPSTTRAVHHQITIIYGIPDGHVWHEVVEAISSFAFCTALLLGLTTALLIVMIRRLLLPIHELATSAGAIDAAAWQFDPPPDIQRFAELRPLASAIERTVARLQASFKQQRRFTSDAAHELKTDLAIIKSSLQLLNMRERTVEEYREGISVGLDDLHRLEATVHKMLTLARLEQPPPGGIHLCSVAEVLRSVLQQSAAVADVRQIRLTSDAIEPALVHLDRQDAMLLCSNVIMNALQHSAEHGEVHVSATIEGDVVVIRVADTGPGILEGDLPFLFEPFYRSDPSRSRNTGGAGLGLAICKAICDRAGGSIEISNRTPVGALVVIRLPIAETANAFIND